MWKIETVRNVTSYMFHVGLPWVRIRHKELYLFCSYMSPSPNTTVSVVVVVGVLILDNIPICHRFQSYIDSICVIKTSHPWRLQFRCISWIHAPSLLAAATYILPLHQKVLHALCNCPSGHPTNGTLFYGSNMKSMIVIDRRVHPW